MTRGIHTADDVTHHAVIVGFTANYVLRKSCNLSSFASLPLNILEVMSGLLSSFRVTLKIIRVTCRC